MEEQTVNGDDLSAHGEAGIEGAQNYLEELALSRPPQRPDNAIDAEQYVAAIKRAPELPIKPPFDILEAGFKGDGMFALEDIALGKLIYADTAILSARGFDFVNSFPGKRGEFMKGQYFSATPEEKECIDAFGGGPSEEECERVMRKYGLRMYDEANDSRAIYRYLSKINHSCKPNAELHHKGDTNVDIHPKDDVAYLRCKSSIKAGDEITINYGAVLGNITETLKEIQETYEFTCLCETCREFPRPKTNPRPAPPGLFEKVRKDLRRRANHRRIQDFDGT